MSFRVRVRRATQALVVANTDRVVAYAPIPVGGKLIRSGIMASGVGSGSTSVLQGSFFALSGQVMSVPTPNTADSVDDVWDIMVPKDKDPGLAAGNVTFDVEYVTAITTPEWNLGEQNWERMFGVGGDAREFMRHRELVTFAHSPRGFAEGTPDTYIPTWVHNKVSNKQISVDRPSVALIAVSSPSHSDTTGTQYNTLADEAAWVELQFLRDTAIDAYKMLMGRTETGAISPHVEALTMIRNLIGRDALEEVATSFADQAWNVFATAFFDIEVPGTMQISGLRD